MQTKTALYFEFLKIDRLCDAHQDVLQVSLAMCAMCFFDCEAANLEVAPGNS